MARFDLDKSNLRQLIIDASGQFAVGFEIARDVRVDGDFERAVFYGEGGSAFPASLVKILLRDKAVEDKKVPLAIAQNYTYTLPIEAHEKALNIFCSYSGNTEETISTLRQAIEMKLPAIGVASGGQIEEICQDNDIPFVSLPMPTADFQPRMGSGYLVAAMLQLLNNHGLAGDFKAEMLKTTDGFTQSMEGFEARGLELAAKIAGKTPVVWANQPYKNLARIWSIKFNEHAKNPAFWNFFPELNHNSMIGYSHLGNQYFAIMLKDPADDPRNRKRYEVTAGILKDAGVESEILELDGQSVFEKLFNSIYLADFTAYFLAEKNGVDPTPVGMVEEFKKRLKE